MILNAFISQVKSKAAVTKGGQSVVYHDVFLQDASSDMATRFPGEIVIRPDDEQFKALSMAEGVKLTVYIKQILELRNGLPVVRANLKPATPTK